MPIGDHVFIVEPSGGKTIELSGWKLQFKVWGEGTGGRLSVTEQVMQPGRLVPPHVHKRQDELSYVLEGTFGVRVGDRIGRAGPGSYFFKPRDVPHTGLRRAGKELNQPGLISRRNGKHVDDSRHAMAL